MKDVSVLELNTKANNELFNRNVPSSNLQPYFSVTPVNTKYTVMPILDVRKTPTEHLQNFPTYNIHSTFNPGSGKAPWSGFANKVHDESILRNQIYAIQHCSQSVYVPSSDSDLYKDYTTSSVERQNPFPLLFTDGLNSQNINMNVSSNDHNGNHTFFGNHTRQQLNAFEPPVQKPRMQKGNNNNNIKVQN